MTPVLGGLRPGERRDGRFAPKSQSFDAIAQFRESGRSERRVANVRN